MSKTVEIISLSAGVQSTAMALMAAHGEIKPMPIAAVFADTGAEPAAVYEHPRWLSSPNVLPFPVHVCQWRNLGDDIRTSARRETVAGRETGEAVEIDRLIRDMPARKVARLTRGGELYVHQSGKPLDEVDLTDPHEHQIPLLWGEECDGMCGL